jgi:hypothetical protein
MRMLRLTFGLLIVLAFANASAADEPQQGDTSYLPPVSLRAAPGSSPVQRAQPASIEPRRGAINSRRRMSAARRYHEPRARRGRRFAGHRSFFGLF